MTAANTAPDWADVLALVRQLDESGLEEAEILADGVTVRVSRTPGGLAATTAPVAPPSPQPGPSPAPAPAATPSQASAAAEASPAAGRGDLLEVTAPMLGVVYLRPAPGRPPFVAVGDTVEPDSSVAIIEVMKMMNTVTSGVGGRVAEIAVEDGAMVEYGAVLLRLEPA